MAKILIGNIKTPLANNLTTTDAGAAALDAAQGKVLDDKIAKNAGDVAQLNSNLRAAPQTEISVNDGRVQTNYSAAYKIGNLCIIVIDVSLKAIATYSEVELLYLPTSIKGGRTYSKSITTRSGIPVTLKIDTNNNGTNTLFISTFSADIKADDRLYDVFVYPVIS